MRLWSCDDDGVLVEVNRTLIEMVGMERADLLGRHVDALFSVPSRIF